MTTSGYFSRIHRARAPEKRRIRPAGRTRRRTSVRASDGDPLLALAEQRVLQTDEGCEVLESLSGREELERVVADVPGRNGDSRGNSEGLSRSRVGAAVEAVLQSEDGGAGGVGVVQNGPVLDAGWTRRLLEGDSVGWRMLSAIPRPRCTVG